MAPSSTTEAQGIDVPPYFLCPISLQIMSDPVTLPTGITYDRDTIEKWLFARDAAATCPVTKQPLPRDTDMTPNHTLRRLIQAWCVANAAHGVERFPTPRQPVDKAQIARLLDDARAAPESHLASTLRRLRSIVGESDRNRRSAEAAGAPDFLISVVTSSSSSAMSDDVSSSGEEALCILHSLKMSTQALCELTARHGGDLIAPLTAVLQRSRNHQSRAYATFLLLCLVETASPAGLLTLKEELFAELVKIIRDRLSYKSTKAALRILAQVSLWGRNRVKAAKAGGLSVVVELLLDDPEERVCEMALVVLDQLCGCAEGRAELVAHAGGLAVVGKKIGRVSPLAAERAVRVIHSVCRSAATPAILQEMVQVGVVTKLCQLLLLQVEYCAGEKTKEKAMDVLRMHWRTWKNSSCIPPQLRISIFPGRH